MSKTRFTDNTYSLAKAMHHINIAKMYFEDLRISTAQEVKYVFIQYSNKCDWIISNLENRLSEYNRKNLKEELKDSLSFEAIYDKLILLTPEQRAFLENIIDALASGQEVKIVDNADKQ